MSFTMYCILHSLALLVTVGLLPGLLRSEADKSLRMLVAKSVTETVSMIHQSSRDKSSGDCKQCGPSCSPIRVCRRLGRPQPCHNLAPVQHNPELIESLNSVA